MRPLDETLDEILAVQNEIDAAKRPQRPHPQGWEPGVAWDGKEGTITTDALPAENAPDWRTILKVWGLDPDRFEVVEPVLFNVWGDPLGRLNRQWKGKVVQKRTATGADVDALISEIRKHRPSRPAAIDGEAAMVVAISDLQLGKGEGGGTAGIVARFLAGIDEVEVRWRELRKMGRPLDTLYVFGLGDVVESCAGHYEMQSFQVDLDRREQITVARRLIVKALTRWATFAPRIVCAAIPGNHGENRNAKGKAFTTFGDNDDVAVFEQAAEIVRANEAYDHIAFVFPKNDLTMTLDVSGTIVGLAHGHQIKGSASSWWAKQALGMQPIGDAQLLLTGHYHHLIVAQSGARTHIQAPSLDGGSQWFTETSGMSAPAGMLTLTVSKNGWDDLRVLPCRVVDGNL
jgi:predicted phosphodiesterase